LALKDAVVADPTKWQDRARSYIDLAERESAGHWLIRVTNTRAIARRRRTGLAPVLAMEAKSRPFIMTLLTIP
jgi:hypothetical protein